MTRASWASPSAIQMLWVTRPVAVTSRVASISHTASIVLGTSFRPARPRCSVFTADVTASNYAVFKGPATLYKLRMMPDGNAFVLTSSNERGGVPSAKMRLPVPNRTG